jgi:uncharacterized protein YbaP (TraB family)
MKTLLTAAVLAFSPAPAFAQAAPPPAAAPAPLPDADPALWVVRDRDTIIYLFGTFHLLDGRPWFNDEIRIAFDASRELVLEAVLPDDQSALQTRILSFARSDGRRLAERLGPEQYAALGRVLAGMGLPADAFDTIDPWFISITLTVAAAQQLGANAANGPETVLSAAARARNMPIGELEGFEWQFRMLDNMPEAQQVAMLVETIESNDELPQRLAPMLAAWSSGDAERLGVLMFESDDADDPEGAVLRRMLFTDRNAAWARWIEQRMRQPGTVFIAVGAGHLAGPDSVLVALRARGLRARRVPHVEAD